HVHAIAGSAAGRAIARAGWAIADRGTLDRGASPDGFGSIAASALPIACGIATGAVDAEAALACGVREADGAERLLPVARAGVAVAIAVLVVFAARRAATVDAVAEEVAARGSLRAVGHRAARAH